MIFGIGNDLCEIWWIERTIARFGDSFLEGICTAGLLMI